MRVLAVLVSVCAYIIYWVLYQSPYSIRDGPASSSSVIEKMVYDQLILFGDSLFQHSSSQDRGFSLAPALQAGKISRSS